MMSPWFRGVHKRISNPAGRRVRPRPPVTFQVLCLEDRVVPSAVPPLTADAGQQGLSQIDHFIIIYQENWSFDGLYGKFPGANGLSNPPSSTPNLAQVDKFGKPLTSLPNPSTNPPVPGGLPVQPYDLSQYVAPGDKTKDIIHRFYTQQLQIDNGVLEPSNGSMDKFVAWSDNGTLVLSYFDATNLPEGQLAQQYTLDDNFFHAAYGGSFLNHQFLIAAAPPQWEQPIPAGFQSSWDPVTKTLKDSNLTIDGKYAVNTTFAAQAPHPSNVTPDKLLKPINDVDPSQPDYTPTIGDRLDDAGVSWKWYSGGWDDALAGHADPLFQYHHQPFAYYARYAPFNPDGTLNPDTTGPDAHLQDEKNFFADLANGDLPAVSFIKPLGPDNEHPGYANLIQGQQHVADIVHAAQNSPEWAHTAIIVTYDENGGRWDHVTPPKRDEWGDGTRVPALVISPYAKKGYVDHTQHDTLSILKTIEDRFGIDPLNERDANATSLAGSFQDTPQVSIGSAYAQPDADNLGKFALIVQGTEGNDRINITQDNGEIRVQINGPGTHYDHFFAQPISRLEVYGQGGNDRITVAPDVTVPAFLFGGAGNDRIEAGGGPSVLVGGDGKDKLFGGAGPSILIGGEGKDRLVASDSGSVLIGGTTDFDLNLSALKALLKEWSRTDLTGDPASVYQQKVGHLSGAVSGGLNGSFALSASTVHDDGASDTLVGGSSLDWFFAHLSGHKKDKLDGLTPGEVVVEV